MRRLAIAGLAGVLALLLGWQLVFRPAPEPADDAGPTPSLAAYARSVVMTATGADGEMAWRVRSPAARYYDDADFWQLDAPRWRVASATGAPWRGRAEHGRSWAGESRARLQGNVVMQRRRPAGLTRLETERIELHIPQRYAETDRPVTLRGPGYRIRAVGARAWLDEERVELLDNARGRYDAASR